MSSQKGGLKLRDRGDGRDRRGFSPIYDMLNTGNLQLLTVSSLKGFIFTLNVGPDDYEYLGIQSGKFTRPVRSYILKFVVISPNGDDDLDVFKQGTITGQKRDIEKQTESGQSVLNEAELQMRIWLMSIRGGKPDICPSVANLSIFNNANSQDLLNFLISNTTGNTRAVFNYLLTQITPSNRRGYGIGVITMPTVENSTTFDDYQFSSASQDQKNEAYAYLAAQAIRLTLKMKVFHFDLHTGNSLVITDREPVVKLIDFGRASMLNNQVRDEFLEAEDKVVINTEIEKLYDLFFRLTRRNQPADKIKFVDDVLNYMKDIDVKTNGEYFGWDDPKNSNYGRFQMGSWLDNYLALPDNIKLRTFDLLANLVIPETGRESVHNETTTKGWMRNGDLPNFEGKSVQDFIVPFPSPSSTSGPASAAAPITSVKRNGKQLTFCDAAGVCVALVLGTGVIISTLSKFSTGGTRKHRNKRKHHNKRKHCKTKRH